jgi:periplasmic protein TonB
MKKLRSTKGFARFMTLSAWLSVMTLAAFAGTPDNKTPDEKKDKDNFIRSEILPSLTDGVDVGSGVEGRIEYPEQAIAQEIEGVVIVEFTIDETGKAGKYRIVQDIGGNCGRAAVKAIGEMQFLPAVQNGYTVPCTIRVPIRFNLL